MPWSGHPSRAVPHPEREVSIRRVGPKIRTGDYPHKKGIKPEKKNKEIALSTNIMSQAAFGREALV